MPWPGWTLSVDAPAASVPAPPGWSESGPPERPPTFLPLVRTVWPSLIRPLAFAVWMLGTSPAAKGPRSTPSSSIGYGSLPPPAELTAGPSHRFFGTGASWAGSWLATPPPPAHGCVTAGVPSVLSLYVWVSLVPAALHTVMSLRTTG